MTFRICTEEYWERKRRSLTGRPLEELRKEAEFSLSQPPLAVTQKGTFYPFAEIHDYVSVPKYLHPDPENPEGPWIYRDGCVNPSFEQSDIVRWMTFCRRVTVLIAAGRLLDDLRFSERAGELLKVWFLNPETAMNPHFQYAQKTPGCEAGNPSGLIDSHPMCELLEAVASLRENRQWTSSERNRFLVWLRHYYDWFRTTPLGRGEENAENNHGNWYDAQLVQLAIFFGEEEVARTQLREKSIPRMARQILPDGKQPLELERTLSLSYCCFNLLAIVRLGVYASLPEIQEYVVPAFRFLEPYLLGKRRWPYPQIAPMAEDERIQLLSMIHDFHNLISEADWCRESNAADQIFCISSGH